MSAGDEGESSSTQKDPRKIARRYQLELCKKALEENIIVYLGTGRGKTHIAVLLIYEMGHLIRKPQKNVCVFLAPTVALAEQQARVIEDSIGFKVGICRGSSKNLKGHHDWEKKIGQDEVLVMTPQILLLCLHHCFIRMDQIAVLIFDECHHAQKQSNHPYAQIMKVFYNPDDTKHPRIFGMTASPVVGKGASNHANLPRCINSLENLLHAKVYTVDDEAELESFVASPKVKVYYFGPVRNSKTNIYLTYNQKLDEIKSQCLSLLSEDQNFSLNLKSLRLIKKSLCRMHDNLIFCLENLGLSGALQACEMLLSGNISEWNELIENEVIVGDNAICNNYLTKSASIFSSDCTRGGISSDISSVEVLKEPFFSKKLLRLIGILSTFRSQPNMKCIIFVSRIVIARCLSYILQNLKFLAPWKCNFLVGLHSGLKSVSRKNMNSIVEKFRSDELNLLVATKVGEEGLDIQTCCLVIRYDLPETVASFIQSRGRARMPQSEYAFLVDSGNQRELDTIKKFEQDEHRMNNEIVCRTSTEAFVGSEEEIYRVDSSGACITAGYSISLLHQYCSKLPHDEYFDPKPQFFFFDDLEGTVCHVILPSNAPVHQVVSAPQSSTEAAKKDACLKACKELHELEALSDYLLPNQGNEMKEELASSDSSEDDSLRAELHEMLVPSLLKEPWPSAAKSVHLNSYFIMFFPVPNDRQYKRFGLFIKAPLPEEAERMKVDLHLSHGRSVMAELVPSGVINFDKDQILQAQYFQEMFLKVILGRSQLVPEFVSLGKNDISQSNISTFYLLLPIILLEGKDTLVVDWKAIMRCISSPIFKTPADISDKGAIPSDNQSRLSNGLRSANGIVPSHNQFQLGNGLWSANDILDSLVYVQHRNTFFSISCVLHHKNGYSLYKESTSFMEHYIQTHDIHLSHPQQPLLKAKQLFCLHNLLHDRKQGNSDLRELEEHFFELPPEICELKILGFSKEIGSSISLLPSIMHRLESLLVAIELKHKLAISFPEGSEVTAHRVLEALTTEKCSERFSLERLEVLGDAFLKYAVGRHLFLLNDALDEGELTRKRSRAVNNSNLYKLAIRKNLQVYIRDQPFDPSQFFAFGYPCSVICNTEIVSTIHSQSENSASSRSAIEVKCSKGHHWLHKKTIADVIEALVGAFIVDSGFKAATAFLQWFGIQVDFEASQVTDVCKASMSYLQLKESIDFPALENKVGYEFLHGGLLLQAFVHPSYNMHGGGCYQRLEFLGDAVMDYLITSYLYTVYPKLTPGQMTDLRSVYVSNKAFANIAVHRSFHKFLISGSNNLSLAIEKYVDFIEKSGPHECDLDEPKCPKVLGDLVESCMGAILLDRGFDLNIMWKIMLSFLDSALTFTCLQISPIRELQELCQCHNWNLQFPSSKTGTIFTVEAEVTGKDVNATVCAANLNRKDAIRNAAQQLCMQLKARGFVSKTKSLEEVLKNSSKMEAKLIGFDEIPISVVVPEAFQFESLSLSRTSNGDSNPNSELIEIEGNECADISTPCIRRVGRDSPTLAKAAVGQPNGMVEDDHHERNLQSSGNAHKGSAKSQLYEICATNYWKPPSFECCKEEGPSHLKLYTFKVVMEIEEVPDMILECFGSPFPRKRAAADHAAEGAIWYLRQQGYLAMG